MGVEGDETSGIVLRYLRDSFITDIGYTLSSDVFSGFVPSSVNYSLFKRTRGPPFLLIFIWGVEGKICGSPMSRCGDDYVSHLHLR